ncbi:hypothetical protein [Agreia sp. Leaf210]|uniref:hypothetical protein n=1 Tax=Agreia sp. Leaf210 TaxID=1735682 RepID=UPI0012E27818|nr:hypothetical protein [Agreia sp. Leaf210]
MEPSEDAPGSRINPFEVALWIVGLVAVAAAVWSTHWANGTLSIANGGYYCDDAGNCKELYDYALVHTVLALAPSVLTSGFIAIIVAFALRAWPVARPEHGRVSA